MRYMYCFFFDCDLFPQRSNRAKFVSVDVPFDAFFPQLLSINIRTLVMMAAATKMIREELVRARRADE